MEKTEHQEMLEHREQMEHQVLKVARFVLFKNSLHLQWFHASNEDQ
jgi:hypothetical protein